MAQKIEYSDNLKKGTDKLNESIEQSNVAAQKAITAEQTANQAIQQSESTQTQLDNIVIEGDSSVEAAQARVDSKGEPFPTLKSRLDNFEVSATQQLQQMMTQEEFDSWVATILDGGPSIFFDTLSALQAAYPEGSAGVALVRETDPAKIYVWSGTEWQDFGEYQGIVVKDGTITYESTNFAKEISKRAINSIINGNFSRDTNGDGLGDDWIINGLNATNLRIENSRQHWTPLVADVYSSSIRNYVSFDMIKNHKYYISYGNSEFVRSAIEYVKSANGKVTIENNNSSGIVSTVFNNTKDDKAFLVFYGKRENVEAYISDVMVVDLTEVFGAGEEPTAPHFEFLLEKIIGKSFFLNDLNLTDAEINGIVTAKDLKLYDYDRKFDVDNVDEALLDLRKRTGVYAENIVVNGDFENGSTGWSSSGNVTNLSASDGVATVTISEPNTNGGIYQNINNSNLKYARFDFYSDSIIERVYLGDLHTAYEVNLPANTWGSVSVITNYTGIFRFYAVTKGNTYSIDNALVVDLTESFGIGNEPSKEKMDAIYETFGYFENVVIPYTNFINSKSGGITSSDLSLKSIHDFSLLEKENSILKESVEFTKSNSEGLYKIKIGKIDVDREEITIRDNSQKQKLILHLHKRENNGYDTKNDVYLPNAEDDFSDVQILSDVGKILPYRVIHYSDDLDVIADQRLGILNKSKTLINSHGTLIQRYNDRICTSDDNGVTWTQIPALTDYYTNLMVNFIAADDALYFSTSGVLFRSPYPYTSVTEVLDTSQGYTETYIHVNSLVQHPDGTLFAGAYQLERDIRIYKSTDNGLTWKISFREIGTYQHVHSMYVDTHQTPVAIYAGVDGGGGLLRTTDKGQSWVDLRDGNPNVPQSTDFGVVYSAPGYRLFGGETSIVGGYSIIKTTDDINFYPVLDTSSGVACIRELNGKLYAGGAGRDRATNAIIYMSDDDGETWKGIYTTSSITDSVGANDGFRYLSNINDEIFVSIQSLSRSPLRILPYGKYAEIIVDIPQGASKIVIESGYAYTNEQPLINDVDPSLDPLIQFDLNECSNVVKESVSQAYFEGDFEWSNGGKHLSAFYPYIVSPKDRKSVKLQTLKGFELKDQVFNFADGITISFWGRLGYNTNVELFKTSGLNTLRFSDYRVWYNTDYITTLNLPIIPGEVAKFDLLIYPDGKSETWVNGDLTYTSSNNLRYVLEGLMQGYSPTILKTISAGENDVVQHFAICSGVKSKAQMYNEYHAFVADNMGT